MRPAVISLCSGSALFGFPIAAGVPAEEVAEFVLGFAPEEYVDVDWIKSRGRRSPAGVGASAGCSRALASSPPTGACSGT